MQENRRDFSVIKDRILKYLDIKGITKYAFYQKSGTTNGVLSQKNGISEDNLLRFLSFSDDVSLTWLFRGEGEMLLPQRPEVCVGDLGGSLAASSRTIYATGEETFLGNVADVCVQGMLSDGGGAAEVRSVPLYNLSAATVGRVFSGFGGQMPVSRIMLPNLPPCDGALYVSDDSMLPVLKCGDIVLYKKVVPVANAVIRDELYLLSFVFSGEEFTEIRRLGLTDDRMCVCLEGCDSPREIPWSDIRALALVKATIRFSFPG